MRAEGLNSVIGKQPKKSYYLSGGTGGKPKLIGYDKCTWLRSVFWKYQLMKIHGVTPSSIVCIAHPFAPWSIGRIHQEAVERVGACAVPVGLQLENRSIRTVIFGSIDITHVCGSPRSLLRWGGLLRDDDLLPNLEKVFVAGEHLNDKTRFQLEGLFNCSVVNVYGMAELDMVGAELPSRRGLVLIPDLHYRLESNGIYQELCPGRVGQLSIRKSEDLEWIKTPDLIRVTEGISPEGWLEQQSSGPESWIIQIIGRTDEHVLTPDGSVITGMHILAIQRKLNIGYLQLVVDRVSTNIRFVFLAPVMSNVKTKEIVEELRLVNIDFADSYDSGLIDTVKVEEVEETELKRTERGKILKIVNLEAKRWEGK